MLTNENGVFYKDYQKLLEKVTDKTKKIIEGFIKASNRYIKCTSINEQIKTIQDKGQRTIIYNCRKKITEENKFYEKIQKAIKETSIKEYLRTCKWYNINKVFNYIKAKELVTHEILAIYMEKCNTELCGDTYKYAEAEGLLTPNIEKIYQKRIDQLEILNKE